MSNEIEWRDIPGYEGIYQVSEYGEIRTYQESKILHQGLDWVGYCRVYLKTDKRNWPVHRLVALAFIGPRPDGHEVNHKDLNKQNNHYSNLEYLTHAENIRHARKNRDTWIHMRGTQHHLSKLTDDDVKQIRQLRKSDPRRYTHKILGSIFHIDPSNVSRILKGEIWKHVKD